jgi:arginase
VSALRAKCPDCRTLTAVAIGPEYQCHSCGREFSAGLVRVPRAWGDGGEAMVAAAGLALPWPEAATIDEPTLAEQIDATARALPQRPLVLGGCCCAHIGAVRELARRHGRIGLVWIDAHGDLNTPESSSSGNAWGMPLRMLLDAGTVEARDVTLLGARNLDPPEVEFVRETGIRDRLGDLPERVYVALDCDVLAPGSVDVFMPEPGGPTPAELELVFTSIPTPAGAGLTGLVRSERNEAVLPRLLAALGF